MVQLLFTIPPIDTAGTYSKATTNLYQDVDNFCKNISIDIIETTVKNVVRDNFGKIAAYIGKYNKYNSIGNPD